jgi:hypothetical protein
MVPAALLGVAVLLGSRVWQPPDPVPAVNPVPGWALDPTPVRQPTLEPKYVEAGFAMRCGDCHDLLPSPEETDRPLTQHAEIVLKHGINTRCFNCHHRTRRDYLVDDHGREIPFDQPQLVCAKCHGPVYRDWLQGVHGRTNGFWNKAMGPQDRRRCVECHDPHVPPFPPMPPAPGPHTLRMGERGAPHQHDAARNPLLMDWQKNARHGAPAEETPGEDDHESH